MRKAPTICCSNCEFYNFQGTLFCFRCGKSVRTDGLTEEEQDRLRLATAEYEQREKVNYAPYMGKTKRSWEGRERDYIKQAETKAKELGYETVGDRMLGEAQYAMRMSMKPKWSPGYTYIKRAAIAVMGADFMTGADAYGELVARPAMSPVSYAAMLEVPWFLSFWTLLLAFFFAGIIFGNFQSYFLGILVRFFKRGFGYAEGDPVVNIGAEPRLRTVGTQSQTTYDMFLTRFDTMRFVAQNQGFNRSGEVEVVYH